LTEGDAERLELARALKEGWSSASAAPSWEQNLALGLTGSNNVLPRHKGVGSVELHLSTGCFGDAGPQRF
jgi:hypothetical protein